MGASHDLDLSYATDLAICVSDVDGIMLSSSVGHARRLARSVDEVIGRNWREWTHASNIAPIEALSARVFSGPQITTMTARRNDGRMAASRLIMMPTVTLDGRHAIMGVHSAIYVTDQMTSLDLSVPLDVARYVGDLSAELARMASQTGLLPLANSLEAIAASFGRVLAAPRSSLM